MSILPAYITDVAKVPIYCSWAVLREAAFDVALVTTTAAKSPA